MMRVRPTQMKGKLRGFRLVSQYCTIKLDQRVESVGGRIPWSFEARGVSDFRNRRWNRKMDE